MNVNKPKVFIKILVLALSFVGLSLALPKSSNAQTVNCPVYCSGQGYPNSTCTNTNPGQGCVYSNFLCNSNPTQQCYCCPSVVVTPSPTPQICFANWQSCDSRAPCCNYPTFQCINGYCQPPPSPTPTSPPAATCRPPKNPPCTGFDGNDPCQAYAPGCPCIENGGQVINSYCYPTQCDCGNSGNDCPGAWTCQNDIAPYSACNQGSPVSCQPGYIVCTYGASSIPCSDNATCQRECGLPSAECRNGFCYSDPPASGPPPTPTPGSITPGVPTNTPVPTINPLCPGDRAINTAIGCIPITDKNSFAAFILRWALGIGGGIATILIIISGYLIISSTGNPRRIQAGKELLTAAITGLLLIIFSAFILRIIGINILQIPGFGT